MQLPRGLKNGFWNAFRAERVARLQLHEELDRTRVIRAFHRLVALVVEGFGAGVLDHVLTVTAAREASRRYTDQ